MQNEPAGIRHARKSLGSLLAELVTRCSGAAPSPLRAVTFWLTVCLPWAILLLTLGGIAESRPDLLAGLVAATLLSAVVGHGYPQRR